MFFPRPLGSAIFCKRDFVLLRPLSRKSSSIPTFPCCSAKDGEQKSPRCRCHERKLCIEAGCTDARLFVHACAQLTASVFGYEQSTVRGSRAYHLRMTLAGFRRADVVTGEKHLSSSTQISLPFCSRCSTASVFLTQV